MFAAVWSVVAVVLLEGVQSGVQGLQVPCAAVLAVEFFAQGAVCAFDMGVVFGAFGRQHIEGDAVLLAGVFEGGAELAAAAG